MATVQGSLANIYNWPASLGVTLGTGQYPNGTITFAHKDGVIENAVWKDNTGNRHTYTICLCDSAGNNRVPLTPTMDIGPSSLTYTDIKRRSSFCSAVRRACSNLRFSSRFSATIFAASSK